MLCWLVPFSTLCQAKDSVAIRDSLNLGSQLQKPEIFTNGFIDIMNNGQINTSVRFIRLFIGEQGKFVIPLSLYSGVSANNFQNQATPGGQKSNDHLMTAFINPLSGLINISSDGILYFKKNHKGTKTGMLFHTGTRVLTGFKAGPITDPQAGSPSNFLNSFATTGFYFQTSAWERSNAKNLGIFWIVARYHGCYTNPSQMKIFLPGVKMNGVYTGYSVGTGVEINNLVNVKAIYYKYIKALEISYPLPIYLFSFNYSMK